jgi:hypothetical protein
MPDGGAITGRLRLGCRLVRQHGPVCGHRDVEGELSRQVRLLEVCEHPPGVRRLELGERVDPVVS